MLGIPHFVIAVNKMDLVGYDEEVFNRFARSSSRSWSASARTITYFLPLSALKGDNVVDRGTNMPWFDGP